MIKKILFIALLVFSNVAIAEEVEKPKKDKKEAPQIIDFNTRKIIPTYNALFVYGGFYYADSLGNSHVVGMDYNLSLTKNFALGASFGYTRAKPDKHITFSQPGFFTTRNMYILDLTAMLFNPVAINMSGSVVRADLFMIAGFGTININDAWEPHGIFGGGMRIYLYKSFLAIRVDLRTNFHSINKPGGGNKFEQNLNLLIGLSFQIPPVIKRDVDEKAGTDAT